MATNSQSNSARDLRVSLSKQRLALRDGAASSSPPPAVLPRVPLDTVTLLDIPPVEVARQLTILDYRLFARIHCRSELMSRGWVSTKRSHECPNVLEMISRFNSTSAWVIDNILQPENPKDRARAYTFFSQVRLDPF